MATRVLFRLILYPLSLLPLWLLYGISYLFYVILNYVIKYRSEIIEQNISSSFPEKNKKEVRDIKKQYYQHFSELAAEMIKMLTISKKMLKKRYSCINPEVVNDYHDKGKSVILMSSHYNNWEWMVLSLSEQFKHQGVGVGAPNSNKVFEKLVNKARTRYGTRVVFANKIREEFNTRENSHIPTVYMMLSDQSPSNMEKSYKTMFLNHPSGVLFGAEYFAKKYNIPVLYYEVIKVKKGEYHIEIKPITDTPQESAHGEITTCYIRLLEKTIQKEPAYWLWSHRRWKHPVAVDELDSK